MRTRTRWWIAPLLNKLPRTCWTNIVSWALGDRRLFDPDNHEDIRQNWMCRRDLAENGICYCRKLNTRTMKGSKRWKPTA